MMETGINEIWYACYGSNIMEERFMCYIQGGTPAGAVKNFQGCSDKTKPKDSKPFIINREMYFAKEAETWNGGGICFLKANRDETIETLGRTYLINSSQFKDLVRQELKFDGEIEIDFEELKNKGHYDCMTSGRYGHLIYLGDIEGKPVVTFTSEDYLEDEINQPSEAYISTIIKGIKEVHDLSNPEIFEYFRTKTGIENFEMETQLSDILNGLN